MRSSRSIKKATAILSGDWHLRDDQPEARVDNYWDAQSASIAEVRKLQSLHDCPVIVAGDLFHKSRPGEKLLAWAIQNLPCPLIAVPGQHDMPNHNIALHEESGLGVLEAAKVAKVLAGGEQQYYNGAWFCGFAYGQNMKDADEDIGDAPCAAVIHHMVFRRAPHPDIIGLTPRMVRARLNNYDIVLAGDNHEPFLDIEATPLVLVPGSLMQMTAAQADYCPKVWLWYADEKRVEPVELYRAEGTISREHIEAPAERDRRIDAFIERLRNDIEIGLSYRNNLESYMIKNNIPLTVVTAVREALGDER